MKIPVGKGMYIWQLEELYHGDQSELVNTIEDLGLSWVAVRIADGTLPDNDRALQDAGMLSQKLHQEGIQFWGWQAVYGRFPDLEAEMAQKRIQETECDGFIVDAEGAFDTTIHPERADAARQYMSRIRNIDMHIGLSTYRFPKVHEEFPWRAFLDNGITLHMPQVYYVAKPENVALINPEAQLSKSMDQLRALKDLPFIPAGAAYHEDGDTVSDDAITRFGLECVRQDLPYFYWEMRYLLERADWFQAVHDLPRLRSRRSTRKPAVVDERTLEKKVEDLLVDMDKVKKKIGL